MDLYVKNAEIADRRAELEPLFARVTGDAGDVLRAELDAAAERFRLGAIDLSTFRARCIGMRRNANGTLRAAERETLRRIEPNRTTVAERVIGGAVAVAGILALGWVVALLVGAGGSSESAPAPVSPVSASPSDSWPGSKYGTPEIRLDMDALPSSDCWYEVSLRDADGKPGGRKVADIKPLCV